MNRPVRRALVALAADMVGEAHPGLSDLEDGDPFCGITQILGGNQALQRLLPVFLASVHGVAR